MFDVITSRLPSRKTLSQTAGFVGGMYLAHTYISGRLEEVKEKLEVERLARENLKRRFEQAHHTASYTTLALLPTLSSQVLTEMDVEAITIELQSRSSKPKPSPAADLLPNSVPPQSPIAAAGPYAQPPHDIRPPPSPSLASSIDLVQDRDARSASEGEPTSPSLSGSAFIPASPSLSASGVQSWVETSGSSAASEPADSNASPALVSASLESLNSVPEVTVVQGVSQDDADVPLQSKASAFVTGGLSAGVNAHGAGSVEGSGLSESMISHASALSGVSDVSATSDSRTKAELWNEVKLLTLTRTLTTLYSITLLGLLTTLQLTLLARSKYVQSVFQMEREERLREKMEEQLSLSNMLFQGLGLGGKGSGLQGLESFLNDLEGNAQDYEEVYGDDTIPEETENKYLTLSWWLLHVGWKDVGERVRRGVEEVFDGVSLKTKLAGIDLHRLVGDVRRRVEYEITFEGNERRINFLSSLLPSTPETIHHVLIQGGFTPASQLSSDALGLGHNISPYLLNPDPQGQPVSLRALSGTTHPQTETSTLSSSQLSQSEFFTSPAVGLSYTDANVGAQDGFPGHRRTDSNTTGTNHSHAGPVKALIAVEDGEGQQKLNPYPHITNDPAFLALIEETQQIISSPDFARVLEVCLDRATEVLFQGLNNNVFVEVAPPVSGGGVKEEVRIRLAGLLPGLARWSQLALNGLPNELVDNLLAVREVPCLSAIVFGKFEERFQ